MFVSCRKCGYDSGDGESYRVLAKKMLEDGGLMLNTQEGWHVECPQGHTDAVIMPFRLQHDSGIELFEVENA